MAKIPTNMRQSAQFPQVEINYPAKVRRGMNMNESGLQSKASEYSEDEPDDPLLDDIPSSNLYDQR